MLTPEDLLAIERIMDRKLEEKLEEKFEEKQAPIKRAIRRLNRDVSVVIKMFDERIVNHEHRIIKLENKNLL